MSRKRATLSKDCLLDELEDLVDEKYFPGELLLSGGKEFTVVSSEKRGGLTLYKMEDGSKIGHRDLKRKKGLSVEDIKQIAIEDADFTDEKVWKVKESLLQNVPIRETKKFASIFNTGKPSSSAKRPPSQASDSESDSDDSPEENGGEHTPRRAPRVSGGPANRKAMEKQRIKEMKEKEKAEKKEKEREEKLRKKEEEKAKKLAEKEKKQGEKAKKNGTMDKFVKKSEANGNSPKASIFSPSKWGERRVAAGAKKLEDSWKKRDQEAFQEACAWCEKNLSAPQQKTIENPIWKFAIQKLVDKTKDKVQMKGMKWEKKAEYKAEMTEKRKEQYKAFEPKIKAWFSEDIAQDDLLLDTNRLELANAQRFECDEELLKCMEITQFFVSMRKILLWNENIGANQLRTDLHSGLAGFEKSTYKMIASLLETALQEKEHEKAAHCNARLSEFPITAHTITELVRAFFIGNTEVSWRNDHRRGADTAEPEEMEDLEKKHEEAVEQKEQEEEEDEDGEDSKEANDEDEKERYRILALFSDNLHIYEWPAEKQLDVLYSMKEVVHGLPIIREWFLRDANSDQLVAIRQKAKAIEKKIEENKQKLADLPSGEITDEMSRLETREMEKVIKKRQTVEKILDELKDEREENREEAARERDDLERIFRVVSIGSDRHLRKYYWFAYSADAGIWVQDFGTSEYEKFVLKCNEKGLADVEIPSEDLPDYVDCPFPIARATETWFKLSTEEAIRSLSTALKKSGKREKQLKRYLTNNMDDILASVRRAAPNAAAVKMAEEVEEEDEQSGENSPETDSEEAPADVTDVQNSSTGTKFTGQYASLKSMMSELLADWQLSGISKIADLPMFETRMDDAKTLEEMKPLLIELTKSIPTQMLIERFPQNIAIAKKCFSHLKMDRFVRRIEDATNSSCLHMLLAYFDARIDHQRTLPQLPCSVCHKKSAPNRKLMCKQCATVYHYSCHKPTIDRETFEEEGFKERWWCAKCTKEERRRQWAEEKAKAAEEMDAASGASSDEDEEEDEEENPRGRNAKRKANVAMRDVLEFEGVLRREPQAPPPPKKAKKEPLPIVAGPQFGQKVAARTPRSAPSTTTETTNFLWSRLSENKNM
uniref:PHD-type domain-containing protein n=1 Tax=Caenorhabditis japonica TaxID=281687 RepID=A0A8R1DX80_CAEJA